MIGRRALVAVLIVAAPLAAAGCTNTKVGPPTTVTVQRTVTPSASSAPAAPSASSTPGRPVSTAAMTKLPGSCSHVLAPGSIDAAVGHRVNGRTVFVVGLPDASIGRLGYINCQYGVPRGNTDVARVEIQVSLYRTASKAAARIKPTVEDYTTHGAHLHKAKVLGFPASLLTGGSGTGYGPTALMALGQRTVVVTLRPGAFPAASLTRDLTALAGLAARHTSAR
jgi:hypothetical protein